MSDNAKHINYPFIEFINKHFDKNKNFFILCSAEKNIYKFENAITKDIFTQEKFFIENMKKAKKIILHGIWYDKLCKILLENEEFFEKTYWIMWGGDFYLLENQSKLKKKVIEKIKYFISDNQYDYKFLKSYYNIKGQYIKCVIYPSNIYKEINIKSKKNNNTINIQIGNSADPSNNHKLILDKLKKYKNENIKIYAILSYGGNNEYIKEIINYGKKIFKNKFIPITKLLPFKKYIIFLSNIDIAIFAHERQQAFGNIMTLLSFGKKVFLNRKSYLIDFLEQYGIKTFDINNLDLELLDEKTKLLNIKNVKKYANKDRLIKCLNKLIN